MHSGANVGSYPPGALAPLSQLLLPATNCEQQRAAGDQ